MNRTPHLEHWHLTHGISVVGDGRCELAFEIELPPYVTDDDAQASKTFSSYLNTLRYGVEPTHRLRFITTNLPDHPRLTSRGAKRDHPAHARMQRARDDLWASLFNAGELLRQRHFVTITTGSKTAPSSANPVAQALLKVAPGAASWLGAVTTVKEKQQALTSSEWTAKLKRTLEQRDIIAQLLTNGGFHARALDDEAAFDLVFRFLNPDLNPSPFAPTSRFASTGKVKKAPGVAPATLRAQLNKTTIHNRQLRYVQLGNTFCAIITLGLYPERTDMGMLNHAVINGGPSYLIVDVVKTKHELQMRNLKRLENQLHGVVNGEMKADASVRRQHEEVVNAIEHFSSVNDQIFELGCTLVLYDRDLKHLERRVASAWDGLRVEGSPFYRVEVGISEPHRQVTPLNGETIDFRLTVSGSHAVHFLPSSSGIRGVQEPLATFQSRYGHLVSVNFWDRTLQNANAVVQGPTGSGKSFLTQQLVAAAHARGDTDVFIVDPGVTYESLVHTLEGRVLTLDPARDTCLNPFDLEASLLKPPVDKIGFLTAFFRTALNTAPSGATEAVLADAIRQTYATSVSTDYRDNEYIDVRKPCFITDFLRVLSSLEMIGDRRASEEERRLASSLATELQVLTRGFPVGALFDGPSTVSLPDSDLVYIQTGKLDANIHPKLPALGTLLITDLIWPRLTRAGRRKLVIFEEIWHALAVPSSAEFIVKLWKLIRTFGGAAVAVSQTSEDFLGGAARDLLSNCDTRLIFRPNESIESLIAAHGIPSSAAAFLPQLVSSGDAYREFLYLFKPSDGRWTGEVLRNHVTRVEQRLMSSRQEDKDARARLFERYGLTEGLARLLDEERR
jgi:TraG P-loop domain